jgi:hypothetical protein|tara:strand:- start:128 stop:844 length:717 start_codon:yes stop_codon:yes gene_type:complete
MSFGGGSSGGGQTQVVSNEPYAPAQPALNQIVSDASAIYGQGPQYVAPTTQQLQGLAAQENIANLANTQIADTISGQYSNPFLSPLIADVASSAYTNVAQQFSGAGRTPGSPMSQQQVVSQLGKQALPLAFQAYNAERNRQLQTARAVPSLTSVGQELRGLEQERVMAPFENLQRFQSVIGPVASGLPSRQASTEYNPNPIGMAAGGALSGAMLGDMFGKAGMGAAIGGGFGLLGGLL